MHSQLGNFLENIFDPQNLMRNAILNLNLIFKKGGGFDSGRKAVRLLWKLICCHFGQEMFKLVHCIKP